MCAKHAAVGQQGVNDLLKRLSSSTALFYLVLALSAFFSFLLGYSRSPPSRTPANLEYVDSGPSSFILNETVSRYATKRIRAFPWILMPFLGCTTYAVSAETLDHTAW